MNSEEMRARVTDARVGRLATVRPDRRPHIVPCVFTLDNDTLYTPVDRKPKRSTALQRLRNLEHEPRAALLVDHYAEDWGSLWWVRLDGRARILDDGPEWARALELLAAKYEQYRDDAPDDRVIALDVERWTGWRFSGGLNGA